MSFYDFFLFLALTTILFSGAMCGTTRPHRWRRETWWCKEHVGEVITAKRQAFKAWKTGKGTRASYYAAKRIARRAVHHARQEADKEVYKNIDPKSSELYHLANQLRKENADVVGDKPVKNDAGEMSMSDDAKGYSEKFEVKVGVHQGSVLSPLLFIIVLEALSREFRCGVRWEDLYADDLVIIAESLEECVRRLLTWKEAMEEKGLRVNAGKTKIMICGSGLDLLQSSGKFPCAVCRTGVGSNSIFCKGYKHWVHKKCSGLKLLTEDPDYRCIRCKGTARPIDGRPQREVQVGPDKLEVVASFSYLGDMLSAAGGCELSTTTRVKTA